MAGVFRETSETLPRDLRETSEPHPSRGYTYAQPLHTYSCEQVIAVLDRDILAQLVGGYRYHQEKCATEEWV